MVSVPDGTGDIPFGMISASQGIYACGICRNGYYITFLLSKNISYGISRISYCVSNISFNGWGLFMSENKLRTLSFEFAVVVVNIVDSVKMPKSSYMIDQFARSGTSIGANIHEAQYAQSKKDFISKLEIALKESNETSYWLKLMIETKRIDEQSYLNAEKLCGTIRRLLIASCRTAKENQ